MIDLNQFDHNDFVAPIFKWSVNNSHQIYKEYFHFHDNAYRQKQSLIAEDYSKFKDGLDDNIDSLTPEHIDFLETVFSNDFFEVEEEYINRFREGYIIQLYSYLESELDRITVNYAYKKKIDSLLKERRNVGDNISFLKKNAKFSFAKDDTIWPFINNFRLLRNTLVHGDASLHINLDETMKNDKKVYAFGKGKSNGEDRYELRDYIKGKAFKIKLNNKDFITECNDKVHDFLLFVLDNL